MSATKHDSESKFPRFLSKVVLVILVLLPAVVRADCECGYASTINSTSYIFTDIIESDFLHLANISLNTDWRRQVYNVSAALARGTYGEKSVLSNFAANPLLNKFSYAGPSQNGGDAGLQLFVRGGVPADGLVPVAEIDSARTDLLWGSYRAAMKMTGVPGTCGAFFWYFNDTQEIDMEFLSYEFNAANNSFPVHLVLQSAQSAAQGFNAAGTKNYVIAQLPFDPRTGFHEYRIDFVPGSVTFYADSQVLAVMQSSAVPTEAGHLILTQWSNGNPLWSAGPPAVDAVMTVSYVKSYFNSSLSSRQKDFATRCINPKGQNAVCVISDQKSAPDPDGPNGNVTANTFFFSNVQNMTNNQTVYHQGQSSRVLPGLSLAFAALLFSSL